MALTNNFIPNTSLVFTPMDYSKQLAQRQADERNAVQGAAKFLGNVIDISKNSQIAEEMNKENPDYKKIDSLAASRIMTPDTSFTNWRWKQGQDQQKALREEELKQAAQTKKDAKEEQKQAFINKLNATLPTMTVGIATTPEQAQMYKNTLAGLEAEAANYGITDPRILEKKNSLYGDLPYNQMMAEMDILNDIDANYGKGSDYDRMNDDQKFEVYQKKLEEARNNIMNNNRDLWNMMQKDNRYNKLLMTLTSNRRPKSKGKPGPRAVK